MLNVTRLLAALDAEPAAPARAPAPVAPAVVVWNVTRGCNLRCRHCYAAASARPHPDELTSDHGRRLIDDLAAAGVRALVLSGGEPLLRADVTALAARAAGAGLHVALSTNGTLVDAPRARALRDAGVAYVGVSIDGLGARHDRVRGQPGAFEDALRGLRHARAAGLAVGVRFTLCRATHDELPGVLDLMEAEQVDRGYVSHLVYVGRAHRLVSAALGRAETRAAVATVFDRAEAWHAAGRRPELVTGNNDADGVALLLRVARRRPETAARLRALLAARGGNQTGRAIGSVDCRGDVHPDQFWPHAALGNVRARPFGAIWDAAAQPLLAALRDRRAHLRGRCAACPQLALCGGGVRVRAEALTGDLWASDPACHVTDAELGLTTERPHEADHAPAPRGDDVDVPRECAAVGAPGH